MDRNVTALVAAALLSAAALASAADDRRGPGGAGGPASAGGEHGHFGGPQLDRLLNMTDEQKTAFEALRSEQRDAMRPLFEEQRRLEEDLRQTLDGAKPDPAVLGTKLLAVHASRAKMKTLHDGFHQKLVDILDPQQREKLQMFESMHPHGPGGPGGPGAHGGPGGPGGPGPDGPDDQP